MNTSISKPLIFVVIAVLVVTLVYSSISSFNVYAVPPDKGFLSSGSCYPPSTGIQSGDRRSCCWTENPAEGIEFLICQNCKWTEGVGYSDCSTRQIMFEQPPQDGVLEQPPTPPPSGPAAPLQDGGVLQQPPTQGVAPPVTRGQGVSPQDGALQQPPADQGATELPPPPATEETQPATEQPVPVCQEGLEFNEDLGFCVPEDCPEGQVLDEESGVCVLEEPEVAEEPAESGPEQEQPSEESESGDEGSN